MKNCLFIVVLLCMWLSASCSARIVPSGENQHRWSESIAESFLQRHPGCATYDSASPNQKWNYEQGFMLYALMRLWRHTGDARYFEFVRCNLDRFVSDDGKIATYVDRDYNLDNIAPGRVLLALYDSTHLDKYRSAAALLRNQLNDQPRTKEGGFWHKKIYPDQMWLDGLFMAEPFYARYISHFPEKDKFDDIANQFIWMYTHARDTATGLLYHAWDESGRSRWANTTTGCSSQFWARAMGWYLMGLIDVLDDFPVDHPKRGQLVTIVQQFAEALLKFRDDKAFLWYQVVDQGPREGNYLETSASAMFVYAFAKGSRKGYLPARYLDAARESFQSLLDHSVKVRGDGLIDIEGTCRSAGLGGDPYRDGSFAYYTSEPRRTNDLKGIGAVLLAALEIEDAARTTPGDSGGSKGGRQL